MDTLRLIKPLWVSGIVAALMLLACTGGGTSSYFYSYERGDCLTNRFREVDDNLDITAQWKYDTLYLTWDQFEGEDFNGYYIVKESESSNSCPYFYVGRDYYEYIGRRSQTYFKDNEVNSGDIYYYRVCAKISQSSVDCGAVQKITIY